MGFTQFLPVMTIAGTILVHALVTNVELPLWWCLSHRCPLFGGGFYRKTFTMFRLQSETRGEQTALIDEMLGNQKVVQAFSKKKGDGAV